MCLPLQVVRAHFPGDDVWYEGIVLRAQNAPRGGDYTCWVRYGLQSQDGTVQEDEDAFVSSDMELVKRPVPSNNGDSDSESSDEDEAARVEEYERRLAEARSNVERAQAQLDEAESSAKKFRITWAPLTDIPLDPKNANINMMINLTIYIVKRWR